ncbi:MAG: hypothetical protein D6780_07310 [Candidatus Dadabacteria bacterium]|nr:MAG: hypothetical protein D6780_07310 [Candidatus Dadabacteria bacterium]
MAKKEDKQEEEIVFQSTRFGELKVKASSIINLPYGLVGFPNHKKFVMLEYKGVFWWLHSVEDPNLAFVVMDGGSVEGYNVEPPYGEKECDFQEGDEFAILLIVTVRPNPADTTVNLKAPILVNLRNKKGMQVIYDDPRFSTRHPLIPQKDEQGGNKEEEEKGGE